MQHGGKLENTSGQGKAAVVPPEVDRWNWGAFLLNWIWGIGNNTFIALLMFVPFANFVMPFVLGANPQAMAVLAPPIKTGMVQGSINSSGPSGKADISFSVEGQKAKGVVYLDATKDMGQWKANRIELEIEGRPDRIDL